MNTKHCFDRVELAGSLGDLGTLLPLAIGLVVVNGLDPVGVFLVVGTYYILSGLYFQVTVPVQPMKVIGAYAIAKVMTPGQITASGLLMGVFMLAIGLTGAIHHLARFVPKPVVRGVQVGVGVLLLAKGLEFMLGKTPFQNVRGLAEPYLAVQAVGPVPIGLVLGVVGAATTFALIDNKKMPAALVVVAGGMLAGWLLGNREAVGAIEPGFYLPRVLPFGLPTADDLSFAFLFLVLPQIPMTVGNAVIATADLGKEYFGEQCRLNNVRALSNSMGLALLASWLFGGMPVCHGAGGLAAHYRFGARTAGSNLMIGALFLGLALFLGKSMLGVIYRLPLSVLGVLLVFAGSELAMMIRDLRERKELFVVFAMLGITLVVNLAAAFIVGIAIAYALKPERMTI